MERERVTQSAPFSHADQRPVLHCRGRVVPMRLRAVDEASADSRDPTVLIGAASFGSDDGIVASPIFSLSAR